MIKKVVEHKVIKTCGNIGLQEALIQVVDLVKEGYDVDRDWRSIYNSNNRNLTYTVHMIKEEEVEAVPEEESTLDNVISEINEESSVEEKETLEVFQEEERVVPEYVNEHKTATDYLQELEGLTKKNDLLDLAKVAEVDIPTDAKHPLAIKKHIKEELEKRG